jgi:hypothetical protein
VKETALIKRAIIAYTGAVAMVAFAAIVAVSRGAGLKPLLILLPLFVLVFGGITYQLIKDVRAMKRSR